LDRGTLFELLAGKHQRAAELDQLGGVGWFSQFLLIAWQSVQGDKGAEHLR